ncbi:hypothetical protein GLOTRDRAFT_130732 [Gloeophyllum trabeum ATCC 11539]|uniref:Uncharacterized protein n=1 Tax=Gloeophyllum trabeum (strain ATCC 11539 / FP-39264 / Madison 617) TaxID=670483 RepID=S7Q2Y7_GLOTA|nr:uncharacterized protein GLOTRDRAFT_130732 [Gloeophyllum trabeum ATCC 11539]EPQ54366.1 hypothetical protein GLOTRDRAFT_130732 [Gloeophyllum trabeum ATCC 11539]
MGKVSQLVLIRLFSSLVAASVFSLIFIIPTFALASRIMYLLFRARVRGSFHNLFDVPFIARAVVFIAYLFIGMVFIAEGISKWTNVSSDIFVSTFPLAVSVIFGYRQATNALRTHVFYRLLNHDSNGDRHPYPFGQSSNFRPRLSRMVTPDVTNFGVADPEATAWHDFDLSTDKRSQGCQYGSDFLQSPPETARNSVEDDPKLDLPVRPKSLHLPTQEGDSERDVGPWDIGSIQSRRAHAVYRRGSELDGMDMSDILFESERDPILEGHRR